MVFRLPAVSYIMHPIAITDLSASGETLCSRNIDFATAMMKFGSRAHAVAGFGAAAPVLVVHELLGDADFVYPTRPVLWKFRDLLLLLVPRIGLALLPGKKLTVPDALLKLVDRALNAL